jgi:hypothetical protein
MCFWDKESNFRCRGVIKTDFPQISLAWNNQFSTLFSGDSQGVIKTWDIKEVTFLLLFIYFYKILVCRKTNYWNAQRYDNKFNCNSK